MRKIFVSIFVLVVSVACLFAQNFWGQSGEKILLKAEAILIGSFTDESAGDVLKNLNNGTVFSFGK